MGSTSTSRLEGRKWDEAGATVGLKTIQGRDGLGTGDPGSEELPFDLKGSQHSALEEVIGGTAQSAAEHYEGATHDHSGGSHHGAGALRTCRGVGVLKDNPEWSVYVVAVSM